MSAWSVKTRDAPSRHYRGARVYVCFLFVLSSGGLMIIKLKLTKLPRSSFVSCVNFTYSSRCNEGLWSYDYSKPCMRSRTSRVHPPLKQCLLGQYKPDVLCPGIVEMRRPMVIRLPPCMIPSAPPPPPLHTTLYMGTLQYRWAPRWRYGH